MNEEETAAAAARRFAGELGRLAAGLAERGIVPAPDTPVVTAEVDTALAALDAATYEAGYAEAVARLRNDDRYRNWWTARPGAPGSYPVYWDGPGRSHLADYLETVGPDGLDVTTGIGVRSAGRALLDELQSMSLPFEANRAAYRLRRALGMSDAPDPVDARGPAAECGAGCGEGHRYDKTCGLGPVILGPTRRLRERPTVVEPQASEPDDDSLAWLRGLIARYGEPRLRDAGPSLIWTWPQRGVRISWTGSFGEVYAWSGKRSASLRLTAAAAAADVSAVVALAGLYDNPASEVAAAPAATVAEQPHLTETVHLPAEDLSDASN